MAVSCAQVIHSARHTHARRELRRAGILSLCYSWDRMKRPYQPKVRRRQKTHGFRLRMRTTGGRNVLKRRKAKGRHRVAI